MTVHFGKWAPAGRAMEAGERVYACGMIMKNGQKTVRYERKCNADTERIVDLSTAHCLGESLQLAATVSPTVMTCTNNALVETTGLFEP